MSEILKIEDLVIEADKRAPGAGVLVDRVSLTLQRGEVLGLIGESGAGKSSVGLAALNYTRPGCRIAGGKIVFDGTDLRSLSPEELRKIRGRRIAYIAQSAAASFNPVWRLGRQVSEPLVRHRLMGWEKAKERSAELFEELSLPNPDSFGQRFPHQVSGGQLQRAMAAMATSCRPDILVLDEPTTALDVTTQIEVLMSLRNLIREHNTAALYISHDLAVVAQVADRIMVLRNGRLVEVGATGEVLAVPREDYTKQLIAVRSFDNSAPFRPAQAQAAPVLEVKAVSADYQSRVGVVSNVSLTVGCGETVAVVGESGSGKTSLARVICGLLPSAHGSIDFLGQVLPVKLGDRTQDQTRRIQMVYQMPDVALNPRHTIGKIIGRPLKFYSGSAAVDVRSRTQDLLEMVDLPKGMIDRRPGELSGGQKQRVCIARALAARPDLMICDEVTSALDPLVADGILRLLQRIQKEMGLAFLFITHDLGLVRRVADRVVIMLRGEVVASGPVETAFSPPFHPYTETLLSSVPELRVGWLDEVLEGRGEQPKNTQVQ